jgi:glycosyltransferase involved in cell wall biosynthesis
MNAHLKTGIIVCYHNDKLPVVKTPALNSILLNSYKSDPIDRSSFDLYDDQGDNISRYNSIYAELTGLYYLWKNVEAPFYGLFHYRRLLDLSGLFKHPIQNIPFTDWPDIIESHNFHSDHIKRLVERHRLILPFRETIHDNLTVEGHYRAAHRSSDLDLLIRVSETKNPSFAKQLKKTLAGNSSYYCTVFIAEKELFNQFCEIIFPIFEAMLPHLDFESEELQPGHAHSRVFGFMGERLLTAFIDYAQANDTSLSPLHVSRTVLNFKKPHFASYCGTHSHHPKPKVSVILPCYNVSEYLPHTFECLRAQTETSLQIIAVDDGSTDNTREIIEHYRLRDPRITSLSHKNCGLGATRNAGFEIASGEYIHFFDPDDFILPTFYETMLHAGYLHNADVVMSCHWVVEPHTPAWDTSNLREAHLPASLRFGPNPTTAEKSPEVFLAHTPVWDKLFRTKFLKENNLIFYPIKAEDIPFTWEAYILAKSIALSTNNLYFYRNRPGSITGSYGCFRDVFEAVYITEDWLVKNDLFEKYKTYWSLKKFVSCAYGMYKIPNYLFSHPRDGHEFCTNLANLIQGIDPGDLSHFSNHALYRDWVGCFNKLKVGDVFANIVDEIARCTNIPRPDFSAVSMCKSETNLKSYPECESTSKILIAENHEKLTSQSIALESLKNIHAKKINNLKKSFH